MDVQYGCAIWMCESSYNKEMILMRLTAMKGKQGDLVIYSGFISVMDFINNTYVDIWELGKPIEEQGCQREPIKSHYRKIGRKLRDDETATLPTSVTLSIDESNAEVDIVDTGIEGIHELIINKGKVYIIDGMHRRYGIEYALNELTLDNVTRERIQNMKLPFTLIMNADRASQIKMFIEINSTAKKIKTDLALQLYNEMNNNKRVYLKKTKTDTLKLVAINICNEINSMNESVWYKSIAISGRDKLKISSTTSFVTSLMPMLKISFVNDIIMNAEDEKQAAQKIIKLINNYWGAIAKVMPNCFPVNNDKKSKWCIQKTPGLYVLHIVGAYIIEECMFKRENIRNFSSHNIADFISRYCSYGFQDSFWKSSDRHNDIIGGEASRANSNQQFKNLAKDIIDDIDENHNNKDAIVF